MPLDDLDLEFEDEDEIKRKKKEAVDVDVDLEFTAPPSAAPRPKPAAPSAPSAPAGNAPARPLAQVKNIAEAKPQPQRPVGNPVAPAARVAGANALRVEPQASSDEMMLLRQELNQAQLQVAVKEAMLEFKVDLLSELSGDMKLLDFQVGQLLTRLVAKHPDSKQEFLMIKKLLADFTAKKRK